MILNKRIELFIPESQFHFQLKNFRALDGRKMWWPSSVYLLYHEFLARNRSGKNKLSNVRNFII